MERKDWGTRTTQRGKRSQVIDGKDFRLAYRIEGPAFIYSDRQTRRVTAILGYPTKKIAQAG